MTHLPDFITFTGVDDQTDLDALVTLDSLYPIEWGVLFSQSRQGVDPRYPSAKAIEEIELLVDHFGIKLAAHICGEYSRKIMRGETISPPLDLFAFTRAQVNHVDPAPAVIMQFGLRWGVRRCIAQTRSAEFPTYTDCVDWLFDASGGRGVEPLAWPPHPGGERLVGYAGGIGPGNVAAVIEKIGATGPYWIDMESGVRTDDRLDLDLCRQVCETVYGARS